MARVEDQSQIGSCSANCLVGAYEYITKKDTGHNTEISRLFIYYNDRAKEDPSSITDSGCTMTNGIEALEEFGTFLESIWPYDISQVNTRPSDEAYQEAKGHAITEALQVNIDLNEMKSCLAQGFHLHSAYDCLHRSIKQQLQVLYRCRVQQIKVDSQMADQISSVVKTIHKQIFRFSHALLAVGYSDQSQSFIVRNSWGENCVRPFLTVFVP